jgi:hypothetical protein
MTPTEIQTLVTALAAFAAAFAALVAYLTKQQVAVVKEQTNSTNLALTAKVDELHAALLLKAETSPALPPSALPGPPQH